MQDEQFDDLIRRKLSESRSTPPPIAFERIRTALPERKRRFAWWYWVPAFLLTVSAGLGYLIFDSPLISQFELPASNEVHAVGKFSKKEAIANLNIDDNAISEEGEINSSSAQAKAALATGNKSLNTLSGMAKMPTPKADNVNSTNKQPRVRNAKFSTNNQETVSAGLAVVPSDRDLGAKSAFLLLAKIPVLAGSAIANNQIAPALLDTAGMSWAYPMPEKTKQTLQYEPFAAVKWSSRNINIQSAEQMDVQQQSGLSASRFQYEVGVNLHKQVSPFASIFGGISLNYLQDQTSVVHHATTTLPCQLYQSPDGNMHLLPQPEPHNLSIRYQSMMLGGQAGVALQLTSKWAIWGNGRLHRQWKNTETAKEGEIKAQLHTTWMPSAAFGLSHTLINKNSYRFSIDPLLEIYPKGAIRVGDMYQSRPMFFGLRASMMLQ